MTRSFAVAFAVTFLSGCVPQNYRTGDYAVLYSPVGDVSDMSARASEECGGKAYRVYDYPASLRPKPSGMYVYEVWACNKDVALSNGSLEAQLEALKSEMAAADAEMQSVATMGPARAQIYFTKERHAITTHCLVFGAVTMVTGKPPAILIAGTLYIGNHARWDGKEYSFDFNRGSMTAIFNPSGLLISNPRHKFIIQSGDRFYGCGSSMIDHNYDNI
jgi:outer membrane murein-binding lipoprotein Lpp